MRGSYPEAARSRGPRSQGRDGGGFGSARGRYQGQRDDCSEFERGSGRGYGSSLEGSGEHQRGSDGDESRSQCGGGYGGQWRQEQPRRSQMPKGYARSDGRTREDVCERSRKKH